MRFEAAACKGNPEIKYRLDFWLFWYFFSLFQSLINKMYLSADELSTFYFCTEHNAEKYARGIYNY